MAGRQAGANRPKIRVTTFDGPGADPVMREVARPKVPPKGALIKIGACERLSTLSVSKAYSSSLSFPLVIFCALISVSMADESSTFAFSADSFSL